MGSTYSGVEGIAIQDSSLQESMVGVDPFTGVRKAWGGICDRSTETLAPTDRGIMLARRKIFAAMEAFQKKGESPPGVDPKSHKVRSVSILLPRDTAYKDGAKDALRVSEGDPHVSV
jgi:hypothetical protein